MGRRTILDYFLENVAKRATEGAAIRKRGRGYQTLTWHELGEEVKAITMGLLALDVEVGDRICLLCNTRLEWILCDLGTVGAGAIGVPIYASELADECQFIAENAGAVLAFTEDAKQTEKFRQQQARLPALRRIIQIEGDVAPDDAWVMSFAAFKALAEVDGSVLEARRARLDESSIYTIIYTSGTTGQPKGVVLTHDNMLYEAVALRKVGLVAENDTQLIFLPLAHSLGRVLVIAWLSVPHVLAFAGSAATVKEDLKAVRPTIMVGVPLIYERFFVAVAHSATKGGGLKSRLFSSACELSQRRGEAELAGARLGVIESAQFALAKTVVFRKIGATLMASFGGRMRSMVSGGAPLAPRIAWFFRDAGLEIIEGYGLTETGPVISLCGPHDTRACHVGRPLPGTEVRIAADGEILVRGPQVMAGYWQDDEATKEVIDREGWLHTGDIGSLDSKGYLRITDRKKDIIVTAGGKNIAPQKIENMLKTHRLISQAVVYGEQRSFLTALITLDVDALREFCRDHRVPGASHAELTQKGEVLKVVDAWLQDVNARLPPHEVVRRFKILEHDFTQETGELTPSLKVKRKVINERYENLFASFYAEP